MTIRESLRSWLFANPSFNPYFLFKSGIVRVFTTPFRVLPDFLIIGAEKCGTTTLYNYLIQHPDVFSAKEKEVNYFVRNWTKWYRSNCLFNLR